MTEIPMLRDALVEAAARRLRRRRRLAINALAWSAAAAAAAAAFVAAGSRPADRELPVGTPPPEAAAPLEQLFPAFARPARAADTAPGGTGDASRLVLEQRGKRVWLVARGEQLCFVWRGSGSGGSGCSALEDLARGATGMFSWAPPRGGHPGWLLIVQPVTMTDVRVRLVGGAVLTPSPRQGALLVTQARTATSVAWMDPSQSRHVHRFAPASPWRPPAACPALAPLPPLAEPVARRVALEAVDGLYPDVVQASVIAVTPVAPGLCTRAVTDRSLEVSLKLVPASAAERRSASLTQGRVLVGMVGGRMAVWSVQH